MTGRSLDELRELAIGAAEPAVGVELARALRNLNEAAIDARPYVRAVRTRANARGDEPTFEVASRILDRLDGAIADAGDVLAGVTS